jgi:hypothetical protein
MTILCPDCRSEIAMPASACPRCGFRLVGADAARLWEVDLALGALTTERAGLLVGLRSTPAARPLSWPASPYASPSASPFASLPAFPQPGTPYPSPAPARRPLSPQQLLLGLGAALLLVASIVFVAVAWTSLGRVVQAVVMAGVTAGTAWSAAIATRQNLKTTAEALGVVASGLVAVDVWATWTLNVANLHHVSPATYAAVGATSATLVLAGFARVIPAVRTFTVGAVLSVQAATIATAVAISGDRHHLPVLLAAALIALSIADRLMAKRLAGRVRTMARTLAAGALTASVVDMLATPHSLAWIVTAAAGAGLLTIGRLAAADRRWAWPAGAATLVASAAAAMITAHATVRAVDVMVVVASTAVLAAAAVCHRRPEEPGLTAVAAACALIGAMGLLHHHEVAFAGGALALTGCAWLLFAALPDRLRFAAPALAAVGVAQICALGAPATHPIDYLTVGVGALVIAISAVYRDEARSVVATAGVALAVLPSAYLSLTDGGLIRPLALGATGVVLLWLASERPNPALFGCSAAAVGFAAAGLTHHHQFGATALVFGVAASVVAAHATWRRKYLEIEIPLAAALVTASLASALAATQLGAGRSGVMLAAVGAAWGAVRVGTKPNSRHAMRAVSAATSVLAITTAGPHTGWMSITLAITGATWLTFAAQAHEQGWALPGVVAIAAAWWLALFNGGVRDLEAHTVPVAALLLAVGLVNLRRLPNTASWVTAGPAVVVGLVPSAFTALFDANALRPMLVIAVSSLLIIAGLQLRWRALILPAAWCLGAVVLVQLAPYAVGAPRWLTLGGVGAVLVAAGARYERRLHDVRTMHAWLAGLR